MEANPGHLRGAAALLFLLQPLHSPADLGAGGLPEPLLYCSSYRLGSHRAQIQQGTVAAAGSLFIHLLLAAPCSHGGQEVVLESGTCSLGAPKPLLPVVAMGCRKLLHGVLGLAGNSSSSALVPPSNACSWPVGDTWRSGLGADDKGGTSALPVLLPAKPDFLHNCL